MARPCPTLIASLMLIAASVTVSVAPRVSADESPDTMTSISLDVAEHIDGSDSSVNIVQYLLRTKLKQAGLDVISLRRTAWDPKPKPEPKPDPKPDPEPGTGEEGEAEEPPPDQAPAVALSIQGRVDANYKPSEFYGEIVAHVFELRAHVVLKGADGQTLLTIEERDRYGESTASSNDPNPKRGTRETTRKTGLSRIATWLYVDLLQDESVLALVPEANRAKVDAEIAKLLAVKTKRQDTGGSK